MPKGGIARVNAKKERLKNLILQLLPLIPPLFQSTLKTISQTYIDKAEDKVIEDALQQARAILLYVEGGENGKTDKT